ncbi:MAG: exodeoxyribonuclease VII small subunit [Ignavibacteria bacterium]|nr:exodeoxyribonuclease VII small subunit [Ignavibacteria bacterium]
MKKQKELSFNQKLARLEEIAALLENDSLELEEAISLYEEGSILSASCLELLKNAELKITQLQGATVVARNMFTESADAGKDTDL